MYIFLIWCWGLLYTNKEKQDIIYKRDSFIYHNMIVAVAVMIIHNAAVMVIALLKGV